MAAGIPDGGSDLRRDNSFQRDARLRKEGNGERELLCPDPQPAEPHAEGSARHGHPTPARKGAVARRYALIRKIGGRGVEFASWRSIPSPFSAVPGSWAGISARRSPRQAIACVSPPATGNAQRSS